MLTNYMRIDCKSSEFPFQIGGRQPFNVVARAYMEPPTKVGPDGSELLTPYVLFYTPQRRGMDIYNN
jgi:hypothetical protein